MNLPAPIMRILQREDINFLVTNRVPRALLTRFVGWFSRLEHPWISRFGVGVLRLFAGLDLRDAAKTEFVSLHDCFTRELKPGARPIEPDRQQLVSPCDALVGACGRVRNGLVLQAKGHSYPLAELLVDPALAGYYADGCYATLRLTAGMYHRFHAPDDCRIEQVTYVSGDTWNVNSAALHRIEQLFCKNERAVIRCRALNADDLITLVPVAAILVASIRLHSLDVRLHLKYRGPNLIRCDLPLTRGQEMGWFEHGSTIIALAPKRFSLCDGIASGARILAGQGLFRSPNPLAIEPGAAARACV